MDGKQFFSALFHDIPDGVCVSDREGRILFLNPAAEHLMGVSGAQAGESSLCALLCARLSGPGQEPMLSKCPFRKEAEDAAALSRDSAREATEQKSVTLEGKHHAPESYHWKDFDVRSLESWKDLRVHCLKITTTLFDPKDPEKYLTLIEDSSQAKEAEREKEDWHTMVVHDLRSPLTTLMGALYSLRDIPPGQVLEKTEKHMIETALRVGEQMLELIQDHLDVARLRAGKMTVRPEELDAVKLLRECVKEQTPSAASKRITIALQAPPSLKVRADRTILRRILQNLINNAVKFTFDSGRIEISGEKIGNLAQISFKDTGQGIPPEDISHIFDRFYRSHLLRKQRIRGAGLGLAFCQEALKEMNGTIQVQSQYGQGSQFVIRLPAAG